jgi:hypothetical protein
MPNYGFSGFFMFCFFRNFEPLWVYRSPVAFVYSVEKKLYANTHTSGTFHFTVE